MEAGEFGTVRDLAIAVGLAGGTSVGSCGWPISLPRCSSGGSTDVRGLP